MRRKLTFFLVCIMFLVITQLLLGCGASQPLQANQTISSQNQAIVTNRQNSNSTIKTTSIPTPNINVGQSINLVKTFNLDQAATVGVKENASTDVVITISDPKSVITKLDTNVTILNTSLLPSSNNVWVLVFTQMNESEVELYFDRTSEILQGKLPDKRQYITVAAPSNLSQSINFANVGS